MQISLGVGLTNECNLDCAHCYRPTGQVHRLDPEQVKEICRRLPVSGVGFGTGESALHPGFAGLVGWLRDRGVRISVASNGHTLQALPDDCLRALADAEVSIDFASEDQQDRFRGQGNWRDVMRALERCRALGVEVSVLTTLMSINYRSVGDLATLARKLGANLRVNVYQPVTTRAFSPTYEQFWESFTRLFDSALLVSCSEPVVCAALGNHPAASPCGHCSVRITPRGRVIPCVYWPEGRLGVEDIVRLGTRVLETPEFRLARRVPESAQDCPCRGGCASRRRLAGNLNSHDEYCLWAKSESISLHADLAPGKALVRSSSVCTTIVT